MFELAGTVVGMAIGLYIMYNYVAKPGIGWLRSVVGGMRD